MATFVAIMVATCALLTLCIPLETRPGFPAVTLGFSAPPNVSLKFTDFAPATGDETTTFTFRVSYINKANKPPTSITTTVGGSTINMAKEDSSDNTYTDGCWYTCSTKLWAGNFTYWINCSDGFYTASVGPNQGPVVTLSSGAVAAMVLIPAGGVILFAGLVIYREKLPPKMQRFIPEKQKFSNAWDKTKTWFQGLGDKIRKKK